MNRKNFARGLGRWAVLPLAALLATSSATAATVELYARSFLKTMPDGTQVTMWGYSTAAVGGEGSPGPVLTVPVGDTSLTINLHNELSVPTSVVIPGLATTLSPVVNAGGRVTSFVAETAPGGTSPYVWTSVKAGTYLYQSGTHPAVQVQMGLYGALKQDGAAGEAYPGQSYTGEQVLVFSEVDPALHAAVANGTYGTPAGPTSTLNYKPAYFLVNGEGYTSAQTALAAAGAAQTTLLRLLNAGLKTHVPALQTGYFKVIAEDGNPYTYTQGVTTVSSPRDQYSVFLAAGKTSDVLWTPAAAGTFALYDRALHLTTGKSAGGMLVKFLVGGSSGPVAVDDSYTALEDQVLTVAAPGVLVNDPGLTVASQLTNVLPASGSAVLALSGGFVFTPLLNSNGPASFTYNANNGGLPNSNTATASINVTPVNDAPSFTAGANQTVNAGAGAQTVAGWATAISKGPANESAQTMLPFVVSNDNNTLFTVQPAVSATGILTYTPVASILVATTATVSVQAKDDGGILNSGADTSAVQAFTITVNPVAVAAKHIGDLDGFGDPLPTPSLQWTARATVSVHNQSHGAVSGATVNFTWANVGGGGVQTASCTTNVSGQCTANRQRGGGVSGVTFTVTSLSGAGGTYQSALNHDPDGNSPTTITILQPVPNP